MGRGAGPKDGPPNPGVVDGVVLEVLPRALYRVELADRRQVLAHLGGGLERNFIRVLVGDRVSVELSPVDLTRGRITRRLA